MEFVDQPASWNPPAEPLFNNPKYYKQVMPKEMQGSPKMQLIYGEFRPVKLMTVLKHHIEYWQKPWRRSNRPAGRWQLDYKLLSIYCCLSDNRKLEWPTVVALIEKYIDEDFGRAHYNQQVPEWQKTIDWIDHPSALEEVINKPYAKIVVD